MENKFDFEGGSLDYRVFTASTHLKDELIASLTSFIRRYSQRSDRLRRSSERFVLTAARLHEIHEEESENKTLRVLLAVFGGVLGAAFGGVTGGVTGAFGGVTAATCARLCGDINAVDATVGFVGSVFGGAVGGAFSGAFGGAVATEATGSPVHAAVSDIAWFAVGFATGGAVGGIFGGTVGAAGGATGAAFGALYGARFAAHLCGSKDSKRQKMKSEKANVMQESGEFRETIGPLVKELKTLKTIGDKMASSAFVHSVAGQTAKTLVSVTTMEKTISGCQKAKDLPQFVSRVEEAARQSKKVTEELEETKAEVERLLVIEAGC